MTWKIPDQVAILLAIGFVAGIILFSFWASVELWTLARAFLGRWGLRRPIFRKSKPNPNQWLVDIAAEDEANPASRIKIIQASVLRWDLEAKRPYIIFRVILFNGTVHSVLFGAAQGYASYKGESLGEVIRDQNDGHTRVPRGSPYDMVLTQYVPHNEIETIHKELGSGLMRLFDFGAVTIEFGIDKPSAHVARMSLGGHPPFIVGQ